MGMVSKLLKSFISFVKTQNKNKTFFFDETKLESFLFATWFNIRTTFAKHPVWTKSKDGFFTIYMKAQVKRSFVTKTQNKKKDVAWDKSFHLIPYIFLSFSYDLWKYIKLRLNGMKYKQKFICCCDITVTKMKREWEESREINELVMKVVLSLTICMKSHRL